MSHTLTYHRIQNVQLRHHQIERGIGPYAPTPAQADAHAPTPANATAPHAPYCAVGSTSVICKMTVPRRRSPFMDELVRSNRLPLHQDWLKDLFDVCMWKQAGFL
ncbi:hypothetical protein O181_032464 [Austropuccinia psidii MF-1]|uniref:Uncharacterized protein n=1 Tax=Austropuccinia psidii MF-1 TaxID=1389203 RepID=A0A9Q3CWV0_9BASI|nr:hypothetical protein [Austropuccinia psidii MF-1]